MDEHSLTEVRHLAVDEGLSLSAFIARELKNRFCAGASARASAFDLMKKSYRLGGGRFKRQELYDRG
jgi:hypothetical protein